MLYRANIKVCFEINTKKNIIKVLAERTILECEAFCSIK